MEVNDRLFKEKVQLLNKAMDAYSLRMRASAKNIANVNTTGYKPERVKFEELFNQQVIALSGASTNKAHIRIGANDNPEGEVTEQKIPEAEKYISGENDLNLDKEMSDIAENQIRFQFASQNLSKHFRQMGAAITGVSNY